MDKKNKSMGFKAAALRRTKIGSYGVVLTAVVIAVVIFINLLVSALPTTLIHFSTEKEDYYSISEETEKILATVDTEVTAYLIAENGYEDGMIVELLSRYEALCSNFKVKNVDPGVSPTFVENYTSESISSNSIIFESENRSTVVPYSEIYQTEYTDEEYYYMMMGYSASGSTTFMGEQAITSAIDFVTRDDLPVVYTLTGHGETELPDTYIDYITDENMSTESLNLLSAESVPEDCAVLLISVPTSDITSDEAEKIIAYMNDGGNVVLLTTLNGFSEETTPNLATVTLEAGMTADTGIVVEYDQNMYYGYPYMLMPEIVSSSTGITSLLSSTNINIIASVAHGIVAAEDTELEITPILQTSDSAVMMDVTDEGEIVEREEGSEEGTVMVGAYSEIEGENGTGAFVWYSSASLIDSTLDSNGITGDRQLFVATLNYFGGGEASVSIIGHSMDVEYLVLPEASSNLWFIVMTIAIPIAFLAGGFIVWFRRRRK